MSDRERALMEMVGNWLLKAENHVIDVGEIQAVQCNFMISPFPLDMRGEGTITLYTALTSHYHKISHVSPRHLQTLVFDNNNK